MRATGQDGVFRFGAADALLGARRHVLGGAVPSLVAAPSGQPEPLDIPYGWVSGGLPVPATGGSYVVQFVGSGDEVRILAYLDPFGRAFATDESVTVPPAREPDLVFAKFTNQPTTGGEEGCVSVRQDGESVEVARYRCARNRYTLFDSWFDFGAYGESLSYEDAMARAYLAFAYRPSIGASPVPRRGLDRVHAQIRSEKPLGGLRNIVEDVRKAERDPALRPPALARCLARWLVDAGLRELDGRGVKDGALRLVRTVRYANTYYLALEDEKAEVSRRELWALEAALNRYLLVSEALGEDASLASDADCTRWDAYLIEAVATQQPSLDDAADQPSASAGEEWSLRCVLGAAMERLRLPVRVEATMRVDVAAEAVAFDITVPDGSFMPARVWREDADGGGSWVETSPQEREQQARRYAMHAGLLLVTAAFDASAAVARVDVVARPFADDRDAATAPVELVFAGGRPRAFFQMMLARSTFEGTALFDDVRASDPTELFAACGACFDVAEADAFAFIEGCPRAAARRDLPERRDESLEDPASEALAAHRMRDVRISYDAAYRRIAEEVADRVVRAPSVADAVGKVRAVQEEAAYERDDRAVASCTRLMTALAEGAVDAGDQNAVVGSFLGEDRCLMALMRVRTSADHAPEEAAGILMDAVAEAAALDGFVDGVSTVYRTFDSYAARVLYNRARVGLVPAFPRAVRDAGKRVELASDSFYLCHLEIVRLLEHSFERTDEALRYGQRAVELAPATAVGYRQLGRAYMLVGDMENAAETLKEGLGVAIQANDIAMLYYQLAYVLWKAGDPEAGAVCYAKSLNASPVAVVQATVELQELVEESGIALPVRSKADSELARRGIPVSPTVDMMELLDAGAVAATDADAFPVARNLLALRLHYRPDDALVNVLRSLED